jgi:ParB/RepB/Spo0J family partition protein
MKDEKDDGRHQDAEHKFRGISLDDIDVPENRARPLDYDEMIKAAGTIKTIGQLQPIGVVRKKDNPERFNLVFGWHRLAAMKLIKEQTGKWPDAFVIILPNSMTDDEILMAELAENLHRFDLTPEQRAEQTLRYAALLKRAKKVQGRRAKQRETKARAKSEAEVNVNELTTTDLPTVTDKTSKDLNVSRQGIDKRVKAATQIAKRAGVDIGSDSPTLENMSAETLEKVADAVKHAPKPKRKKAEPEREISTQKLLAEDQDHFERAKRVADQVRKFKATLRGLKMPAEWADINPDSHAGLIEVMSEAFFFLYRAIKSVPPPEPLSQVADKIDDLEKSFYQELETALYTYWKREDPDALYWKNRGRE